MKTRILAALVLVPVLVLVLVLAPVWLVTVAVGLMAAVASYELLHQTGLVKSIRLKIYSALMAFLVCVWSYHDCSYPAMILGILAFHILIFSEVMLSQLKMPIGNAFLCMLGAVVLPFFMSALIRILQMEAGRYLIWIPFVMAFVSDTGAYFAGVFFGKHKLCPTISPKKTVEGFVGGIVLACIAMVLYGVLLDKAFHIEVNYLYLAVYGLLGSLGGVFGDLSLSVIKRQTGIKDYGNLIPGHGGILDRFDSVLITAPLTEALLLILPVVV